MTNNKNKNNEEETFKNKRSSKRRAEPNRRESVRFGDALGRRDGNERRSDELIKPG